MIAILGCGPSGLLAVHAAIAAGVNKEDIWVYSKKRKSHLHGAQYMGASIPGLDMGEPVTISYELVGTQGQYRNKVYGENWEGDVSPKEFEGEHEAWDIRRMYDQLWERYSDRIVDEKIDTHWISMNLPIGATAFNSIPKSALCYQPEHDFISQNIWAMGEAKGEQDAPVACPENSIVCNGLAEVPWYRVSNVFNHTTVEWPDTWMHPPHEGAVKVQKPLSTDCDCWSFHRNIVDIGRFGRWEKKVLVHHTWNQVLRELS